MEVWSGGPCRFCQGTGVKVPKVAYERWNKMLEKAQMQVAKNGKPIALFKLVIHEIEQEMMALPNCSWCEGRQVQMKREPDCDPDDVRF